MIAPPWRIQRFLVAAAAMALLDAAATVAFVTWADSRSTTEIPATTVLAALYGDEGTLSENTERTLGATLGIVRPDTTVLCIGGARPILGFHGAEAMALWLENRGLDRGRLHVDRQSYDTDSNLEAIARWQLETGLAVTVVVDALHAPRVRARIARDRLDRIAVYAYPFTRTQPVPSAWSAWARVHHEAVAIVLESALPTSLYRELLRQLRSQK